MEQLYKQLQLENQLCFSIYATSREITKVYKPLLDKLRVTYPQYLALLVLWEHETLSVKKWANFCIWIQAPLLLC